MRTRYCVERLCKIYHNEFKCIGAHYIDILARHEIPLQLIGCKGWLELIGNNYEQNTKNIVPVKEF